MKSGRFREEAIPLRIISGSLKGARIATPRGRGTRPTADRVREAIFSILGNIEGAKVLDLFAGSGALALEAMSRGAASAVMVDSSSAAVKAMRKNLDKLKLEDARISRSDYLNYLDGAVERGRLFNLIFVDPPYRMQRVIQPELVKWLPEVSEADGRIVVESSSKEELSLPFELLVHKVYGDTAINIYRAPAGHLPTSFDER